MLTLHIALHSPTWAWLARTPLVSLGLNSDTSLSRPSANEHRSFSRFHRALHGVAEPEKTDSQEKWLIGEGSTPAATLGAGERSNDTDHADMRLSLHDSWLAAEATATSRGRMRHRTFGSPSSLSTSSLCGVVRACLWARGAAPPG